MAKYEVIKDAGAQYPVGFEFETENLHPSMVQHVRQVGRTVKVEPEKEPEKAPEQKKEPVKKVDKTPPAPTPDADDDNT